MPPRSTARSCAGSRTSGSARSREPVHELIAGDPMLRREWSAAWPAMALMERIAREEAEHAELAWRFVARALQRATPALGEQVRKAFQANGVSSDAFGVRRGQPERARTAQTARLARDRAALRQRAVGIDRHCRQCCKSRHAPDFNAVRPGHALVSEHVGGFGAAWKRRPGDRRATSRAHARVRPFFPQVHSMAAV